MRGTHSERGVGGVAAGSSQQQRGGGDNDERWRGGGRKMMGHFGGWRRCVWSLRSCFFFFFDLFVVFARIQRRQKISSESKVNGRKLAGCIHFLMYFSIHFLIQNFISKKKIIIINCFLGKKQRGAKTPLCCLHVCRKRWACRLCMTSSVLRDFPWSSSG